MPVRWPVWISRENSPRKETHTQKKKTCLQFRFSFREMLVFIIKYINMTTVKKCKISRG